MTEIDIPPSAWQPNAAFTDPRSRMLTTVHVNGVPMHLEAWEVRQGDQGVQVMTCAEGADDLNDLSYIVGADGHFQTLEIAGREYVLVASPYSA